MNNLVHIPTTRATQRGERQGGGEGEVGRWRKGEMDRGGEIKAKGKKRGMNKGGERREEERQLLPRCHMTVLLFK